MVAPDGHRGIELARSISPALILLDLHLPDLPGEEVLRLLWTDPALRVIPVVILSADATPRLHERLQALGAAGYLTKPFIVKDVLQTVDAHLEGSNGREQRDP